MQSQNSRKRLYFKPPLDESQIEICFLRGAEYDEGRHELFISQWQDPLDFLEFFEDGVVPKLTDPVVTQRQENIVAVNFGWNADEPTCHSNLPVAQQGRSIMSNKKVYLNCPYDNKDQCKALGGRWDPDKRMWYVPTGYALDPFRPWWPKDVSEQVKNTFGSIDHPIVEE
jgi:hypothetical protein